MAWRFAGLSGTYLRPLRRTIGDAYMVHASSSWVIPGEFTSAPQIAPAYVVNEDDDFDDDFEDFDEDDFDDDFDDEFEEEEDFEDDLPEELDEEDLNSL
jgi:hypothetical protein